VAEPREVHIEFGPNGIAQRLDVGGIDMANVATAFSLSAKAREIPWLILTLPVMHGGTIHGERVYVEVDRLTAEALKALGWTPPGGDRG